MGTTKRRSATKKLNPIYLDRNVITFHTRYGNRYFSVHADLLYNNSKYFKQRLQNNRKAIDDDCSICQEKLDPYTSDISFCEAYCGQNFHKHYRRVEKRPWKTRPRNIPLPLDLGKPDLGAIESYVNWLYTGELYIVEAFDTQDSSSYNLQLLMTWRFAVKIEDDHFKNDIIAECVTSMKKGAGGFDPACIEYAYTYGPDCMRDFLVDAWLADKDLYHSKYFTGMLLVEFVRRLCVAASAWFKECVKHKGLIEKYTGGEYEYTENEESAASESETDTEDGE